jgi:bifunctional non-homologous end joining protein LigD
MSRLAPMLATIGSEIPRTGDWVFEPKFDGIRILAFADGGNVVLMSRNGLNKTRQFPEVAEAVQALARRAKRPFVIDGEIVSLKRGSPARFQDLQSRMHVTDQRTIDAHRKDAPVAMMTFDILLDGKKSLVGEPWRTRRQHLDALFPSPGRSGPLRPTEFGENGDKMLREARRRGWEGVIAKRADADYRPGKRSRDWLKLKIERRQEFVIGGWTEPRRSREHFGALLLGYYDDDGSLVYAGHTGTGFTRQSLADLSRRLKRIERKHSPFSTTPHTNEKAHWVRPSVIAEIKFNEWTAGGRLRQPVFIGLRDDKSPRDVVAEPESLVGARERGRVRARSRKRVAASVTRTRRRRTTTTRRPTTRATDVLVHRLEALEKSDDEGGDVELPSATLEVSNLTKVFFPATKTTKGDLMRYYARVSPYILPAMADRPLVMKRFPNGVNGKSFYQQRAPESVPDGVRVESVSDKGMTTQDKIIGGDLATLLYVVQLGAISIDPWHSRVGSIKYADYAIIDLDPGPRASFSHVVEVALAVKESLDELGLHAVPKTSGASGLHIVLPLPEHVPNDAARMVAEVVARRVAERHADIATVERSVSDRPRGAIYVDFLQNIRGKTVAGVYSARAERTPTVSTPLQWSELEEDLDPTEFTIDNVPTRLRRVGDLWAKGMKKPNALEKLDRA